MQKISTTRATGGGIFKVRQLTIGLDLGDRWSFYCQYQGEMTCWKRIYQHP